VRFCEGVLFTGWVDFDVRCFFEGVYVDFWDVGEGVCLFEK
jgi:hypothetical protein